LAILLRGIIAKIGKRGSRLFLYLLLVIDKQREIGGIFGKWQRGNHGLMTKLLALGLIRFCFGISVVHLSTRSWCEIIS